MLPQVSSPVKQGLPKTLPRAAQSQKRARCHSGGQSVFHQELMSHPRAAICILTGDGSHSFLVTRRLHVASHAKMKVKTVIILQPVFNALFIQVP